MDKLLESWAEERFFSCLLIETVATTKSIGDFDLKTAQDARKIRQNSHLAVQARQAATNSEAFN